MMEIGATVCLGNGGEPKCGECPLSSSCGAYADMRAFLDGGGHKEDDAAPLVTTYPTKERAHACIALHQRETKPMHALHCIDVKRNQIDHGNRINAQGEPCCRGVARVLRCSARADTLPSQREQQASSNKPPNCRWRRPPSARSTWPRASSRRALERRLVQQARRLWLHKGGQRLMVVAGCCCWSGGRKPACWQVGGHIASYAS